MNNPTLSGAAESAAPAAALPISSTPTPGVQETPAVPTPDLQLAAPDRGQVPTIVTAKPVLPLASLPKTRGLQPRQRLALQALAAGNTTEDAARLAEVNPCTVHRWRKHHPAFIAAWNAWQAQSVRSARGLLAAANEHAARTVLRATQNGDVRVSLALLKGMGTLTPLKIGPEFAKAVKRRLSHEADEIKSDMGSPSRALKERLAELKWRQKEETDRAAATAAQKAADEAAMTKKYFDIYPQIPPLSRPLSAEAITPFRFTFTTGLIGRISFVHWSDK